MPGASGQEKNRETDVASKDLAHLLSQLRGANSQLEQLKVLVRGWRQLRSLSASERKRLALTLGWDSAEALVDRLGERGGLAPSLLLKAVRDAERNEPGSLAAIFSGLRTPGARKAALEQSLDFADRAVGSLDSATPQPPETPPPPPSPQPPARPQPAAAAPPPPPPKPVSTQPPVAAKAVNAAEVEASAAKPAPKPPAEPKPSPRDRAPAIPPKLAAPPQRPDPWAGVASKTAAKPVPTPAVERLRPSLETSPAPGTGVAPGSRLVENFRSLRELPAHPDRQTVLERLQQFPDGWPRRRALRYLVESGRLYDSETVLEQIAALSRPTDRYWCASAWLAVSIEPREDLSRLLPLLPPVWIRRLQRRF